jgi:hypothetical protein
LNIALFYPALPLKFPNFAAAILPTAANEISSMTKKVLQFIFFLGLGTTILALVFSSQNKAFQEQCRLDGVPSDQCSLVNKLFYDFSTVHLGWLGAVLLAFTLSNIFRALRWQMLHHPMGYQIRFSNAFLRICQGWFTGPL